MVLGVSVRQLNIGCQRYEMRYLLSIDFTYSLLLFPKEPHIIIVALQPAASQAQLSYLYPIMVALPQPFASPEFS